MSAIASMCPSSPQRIDLGPLVTIWVRLLDGTGSSFDTTFAQLRSLDEWEAEPGEAPTATLARWASRGSSEGMTLGEALAYWQGEVDRLDAEMAPHRAEEDRLRARIVATHCDTVHGKAERRRGYRIGTRDKRAPLFEALDALQPMLGPLRRERQAAAAEIRSVEGRMKAQAAVERRDASRAANASARSQRIPESRA